MDRKKIIAGLEFTKAMITFNPSTGQDIEPENLNDEDKTTYDACVGAIALLKEQEAIEPKWFIDAHHPAGAFRCSSCGERIVEKDIDFYCSKCGKPILWERR